MPASLLAVTTKAALLVAAGPMAAAGIVSATVNTLAEGVLKTMFLAKVKTATVVLFGVTVLGLGTGGVIYQTRAGAAGSPQEGQSVRGRARAVSTEAEQEKEQLKKALEEARAREEKLRLELQMARMELDDWRTRLEIAEVRGREIERAQRAKKKVDAAALEEDAERNRATITVTPATVILGKVKVGDTLTRRVVVRGNKTFRILQVEVPGEGVITLDPPFNTPSQVHTVTFKCQFVKAGDFKHLLKIKTDLQENPVVAFVGSAMNGQQALPEAKRSDSLQEERDKLVKDYTVRWNALRNQEQKLAEHRQKLETQARKEIADLDLKVAELAKHHPAAQPQSPPNLTSAGSDKLDQILQRLERMEKRLDHLERRGK